MKTACNVEKQRLMNAIYQCGFAISDITLFLDTHPKDPDALDYFQHMKHKYNHFVAEYETKFGPLTQNRGRIIGSGPYHHGHGKGGTTNLCGTMKKDYSIRFVSQNLIRRLQK